MCLSLAMLAICVVVWVTKTPISTGLPNLIGDVDDTRRNYQTLEGQNHRTSSMFVSLPDKNSTPFREYIKSGDELRKVGWVTELHDHLLTLNKSVSPHVNMVFGDYFHRILVLNWIVGALVNLKTPLSNVLVISLDHSLCDIVSNQMYTLPVTCITAPVETIISFERGSDWITATMVRPLVLRLINFWGYDVATYDSDAVILKNPQVLYDQHSDVKLIASPSIWPEDMSEEWGFTLCTGALLLKASSTMGRL